MNPLIRTEIRISLAERVLINAFTPIDYVLNLWPLWEGASIDRLAVKGSIAKSKERDYERLLNSLTMGGYNERIVKNYTDSICGRIQIRLAKQRGLIPQEEYEGLVKKSKIKFL